MVYESLPLTHQLLPRMALKSPCCGAIYGDECRAEFWQFTPRSARKNYRACPPETESFDRYFGTRFSPLLPGSCQSGIWPNSNCVSLTARPLDDPSIVLIYLSDQSFHKSSRVGSGRVFAPLMNCNSSSACTIQKSRRLSHISAPAFGNSLAYCSTRESCDCTLTRAM